MIVAVPLLTPVTIPVLPTVATAVLLLLQVPPLIPSVKVIVDPVHTLAGPVMVPAVAVVPMDMGSVAMAVPQLLLTVYTIVSRPALTAVNEPTVVMVALALVMLQVPPGAASVYRLTVPTQRLPGPLMEPALGKGLTVTARVAAAVPQLLLTV